MRVLRLGGLLILVVSGVGCGSGPLAINANVVDGGDTVSVGIGGAAGTGDASLGGASGTAGRAMGGASGAAGTGDASLGGASGTAGRAMGGASGAAGSGSGGVGAGGAGGEIGPTGCDGQPLSLAHISSGVFPFPGRWWGHFVVAGRDEAFVVHWNASDPDDRALWTSNHTYGMIVSPEAENGVTFVSNAPQVQTCWGVFPTSDPDLLQVQPCDRVPSSGTPPLGYLHRAPPLAHPIGLPPIGVTCSQPLTTTVVAFDAGGQRVVSAIDRHLMLWANDLGRAFDLGAGGYTLTADFSSDGRRVLYPRTVTSSIQSLIAYDTVAGSEELLSSNVSGDAPISFSSDGRWVVFYEDPNHDAFTPSASLVEHDFETGRSQTVAQQIMTDQSQMVFLTGGRLLVRAWALSPATSSITETLIAFDPETSVARILENDVRELVGVPGGAFAAYRNAAGDISVIDAATFTPQVIGSTANAVGNATSDAGFAASPDGKQLTYADGLGLFHLRDLTAGIEVTLDDQACPYVSQFIDGGAALVHAVGFCSSSGYASALARYDLATGQESTVTLGGDSRRIFATGPNGDVVFDNLGVAPDFLSWPIGRTVALDIGSDSSGGNPRFAFSANGRFLTYSVAGGLMVRDITAAKTEHLADLVFMDQYFASQTTAVTVLWGLYRDPQNAVVAYAPGGSSQTLGKAYTKPIASASSDALAFLAYDGTGLATATYPMRAGTPAALVGNGQPLGVSNTQVVFRDLDGICSYSF